MHYYIPTKKLSPFTVQNNKVEENNFFKRLLLTPYIHLKNNARDKHIDRIIVLYTYFYSSGYDNIKGLKLYYLPLINYYPDSVDDYYEAPMSASMVYSESLDFHDQQKKFTNIFIDSSRRTLSSGKVRRLKAIQKATDTNLIYLDADAMLLQGTDWEISRYKSYESIVANELHKILDRGFSGLFEATKVTIFAESDHKFAKEFALSCRQRPKLIFYKPLTYSKGSLPFFIKEGCLFMKSILLPCLATSFNVTSAIVLAKTSRMLRKRLSLHSSILDKIEKGVLRNKLKAFAVHFTILAIIGAVSYKLTPHYYTTKPVKIKVLLDSLMHKAALLASITFRMPKQNSFSYDGKSIVIEREGVSRNYSGLEVVEEPRDLSDEEAMQKYYQKLNQFIKGNAELPFKENLDIDAL